MHASCYVLFRPSKEQPSVVTDSVAIDIVTDVSSYVAILFCKVTLWLHQVSIPTFTVYFDTKYVDIYSAARCYSLLFVQYSLTFTLTWVSDQAGKVRIMVGLDTRFMVYTILHS